MTVVEQLVDLDLLAAAEASKVIDVDTLEGIVSMAHPLYGEVLRLRMPNVRVRQLRATLARQPAATDPLLRAVWVLDGGGAVDQELFAEAAITAVTLHQYDLARRLGGAALSVGPHARAAIAVATAANRQRDPHAAARLADDYPTLGIDGELAVRLAAEQLSLIHISEPTRPY